jgi:hypothetical protein
MIELMAKHYKSGFDDQDIKPFMKSCLKMVDNGLVVHNLPKVTRDGIDLQVGFNKAYTALIDNMEYEAPFSQEQMFEICTNLFTVMFEYRLFTSGTGFESRFKTPQRMSSKLSSFWYDKRFNRMTVPAEIYDDHGDYRTNSTIPVSLTYDIIFNEYIAGIQHTFHTPTKFSSAMMGQKNHQELIINFRKLANVFYYNVKIISLDDLDKENILFQTSKTFEKFDDFLAELTYVIKRELFNINYKARFEAFTGTTIDFESFDVESINTLFDMMKI